MSLRAAEGHGGGSGWLLQITTPTELAGSVYAWTTDDGNGVVRLGGVTGSHWLQVGQSDDVISFWIHYDIARQLSSSLLWAAAQNRELRRLAGASEPPLFARIHTAADGLLKVEEPSDWIGVARLPVGDDSAELTYEDDLWNLSMTERLAELLALSIFDRLGQISTTRTWSERKVILQLTTPTQPLKPSESGVHMDCPALEEVGELLAAACQAIAEACDAKFEVIAFSRMPWKVDLATDLAAVLEQLPGVLHQLRNSTDAVLDFKSVERTLRLLHYHEPALTIECESRSKDWWPQWPYKRTAPQNVIDMLHELGASFYTLLQQVSPKLAAHARLQQWRGEIGPT